MKRTAHCRAATLLVQLKQTAKEIGIPVVYSPHYYSDEEFSSWSHLNPIDRLMFDQKMFRKGTWGAEFHPQLQTDENTIVLSPHKALSNFWSGDVQIQLRQRNIQTIILAGMSANLCVESHPRDAIEHGFDVLVVKDATTGPGKEATQAAYVNYGLIANEVVTTEKIIHRLKQVAETQVAKPMA